MCIYMYIISIYTIDYHKLVHYESSPKDRERGFVHVGGLRMTRELLVFTALMSNAGVAWQRTGVLG